MFPADANFSNSVASIRGKSRASWALSEKAAAECERVLCFRDPEVPGRPRPLILSPPPPTSSLLK